jgi:hypothetical protein
LSLDPCLKLRSPIFREGSLSLYMNHAFFLIASSRDVGTSFLHRSQCREHRRHLLPYGKRMQGTDHVHRGWIRKFPISSGWHGPRELDTPLH